MKGFKEFKEELRSFIDFAVDAIVVIIVVFALRSFIISPYAVNGKSMENTIHDGELLIANRFVFLDVFGHSIGEPHRGDIIIFYPPENKKKYYIKRVIGLPGETIYFKNGEVFIKNKENPEGAKLIEPYLSPENQGKTFVHSSTKQSSFKIPEGNYFVMGDNRLKSSDSRRCFSVCTNSNSPFLPRENIISKSWFTFWPIMNSRFLGSESNKDNEITYKEDEKQDSDDINMERNLK